MLKQVLNKIDGLDEEVQNKAKKRLGNLTKPPGSLGKLEEMVVKMAGITGDVFFDVDKKVHIVMVGDHGVVEEGVSAFPQEVTYRMVENFIQGGAAINVLTDQADAELKLVDIGMKNTLDSENIMNYKVKNGTDNFSQGPAMSREEAIQAVEVGIKVTQDLINQGYNLIGTGEMGIGNTSPSSAVLAVLTDYRLEEIVGPGTGLSSSQVEEKAQIIKQSIKVNQPDPGDPLDVLSKVGALEIAGMAGCMLAGAAERVPVLIDGFISGAAALIAYKLEPGVVNYLLPSHISAEPGHKIIYDLLGLSPLINLNMRLGEGTGAVLAMDLIEASSRLIKEMSTFSEVGIKH